MLPAFLICDQSFMRAGSTPAFVKQGNDWEAVFSASQSLW
jgi:hypothetical protein